VTSFALLADPTRVRILWALRTGECDVAGLAEIAGCRPTVASPHLSKLRLAGLVEGTRDGAQGAVPAARGARSCPAHRGPVPCRPSSQRRTGPRL